MLQKYIALLNQAKNYLPYHVFLSRRIVILTVTFMLLLRGVTAAAQTYLKVDDRLTDQALNSGKTEVIIPYGSLVYYSLGICFILEMIAISFVIRNLRKKKNLVRLEIIQQMQIKEKNNEVLNAELSALLEDRTLELKKSIEIIQRQNEEISMMNAMLKKDSSGLNLDVEQVRKAPVMSKFVDFEAFSEIYPDKDSILKYIAGLKWGKGYSCIRCCNETYLVGQTPYGRRCTKCGYDESATVNTIFHNSKILINKALYMLILVYNSKGTISSYKLAELLDIRQSTCWVYSSRFKKRLSQSKDSLGKADGEGWSRMVLDPPI
jgi:hypothetical protein